jgi:Uma2 family endonuclease
MILRAGTAGRCNVPHSDRAAVVGSRPRHVRLELNVDLRYDLGMNRVLNAKLTYEDYASAPADGMIYQVVDGDLLATPAPSPSHQRASKRLQRQLEASRHDIVRPDLVVVTDPSTVTGRGIEAPPLLIVEVISPSSVRHDRELKAHRYAVLGVPHYWILDPDQRRLECFTLRDGAYEAVGSAAAPETLDVANWPGLTIDLGAIWR